MLIALLMNKLSIFKVNIIRQMLCTYCKKQFDEKLNIPRLLILCGHSLCQTCCYRLHLNNRVECPQCHASTFIESISLLPKNLALITHHSNTQICPKHHKKYEAFCEKENVLICIECILQDGHKNHQMDSIHNSFENVRQKWLVKMEKIVNYSVKLEQSLEENKKGQAQFQDNYRNIIDSVGVFFKQIREIINRQQQILQTKFKQLFNQTTSKYSQKSSNLNTLIQNAQINISNFNRYENLTQIQFLQSFNSRENMYGSISQAPQEPVKSPTFVFSKKSVLDTITKSIQSLVAEKVEKGDKKISAVCINNYSSNFSSNNSQQFKKVNETPVIKAVRKAVVPQNTPSNINLSNKKKVSVKKDITNIVAQNPTTVLSNKSNNNSNMKVQIKCNNIAPIKSDISSVDPKQSLCRSFLSNMTSFLGQRKSIYLLGGFNQQANNIIKLNLFSWHWEEVCCLNTNRSKFGSIAIDQQVYLFGGKKGKQRVNDSEMYNISTNKWTKFEAMNKNRSGFSVIHISNLLYFIGGNDGESILNTVQTFNVNTGQWKKIQPMNQARDQLAVVVGKNNKIYAIGGFGGINNSPLKSVEVYDPKTEKWRLLPNMNEPRRALAAAVLADGIYAIGGFDGNSYMSSVQKFEEGDREWTYVASMKQARCTHSAVSISQSQQIFVFGGFDFVPLDTVEKYNVISNEWESVCKMPTPRFMHSSLLIKQD